MPTPKTQRPTANPRKSRDWQPHLWEGCDAPTFLRLLARNRFAVDPVWWHVPAVAVHVTMIHSMLRVWQDALYGRRVRATPVVRDPVFILGHWRAGTTLLHELMVCDPRLNFPNTFQCFVPNHLLLSEGFFRRFMRWVLPDRRPVDNMRAGWELPQEDEFALALLGAASPYLTIAFPNRPPAFTEYLDFDGVPPRDREAWKRTLFRFVQTLTFRDPRRLVMKSPTHTGRIPVLLELFPDARFVHITRNPFEVFPSTVNLWKRLYAKHGMQTPTYDGLEEKVFADFLRLDRAYQAGKALVRPGRLHELRFEDLTADPEGGLRKAYAALELGDFGPVERPLADYLARAKGYERNRFELPAETRAKVAERWGEVIRRDGYASGGVGRQSPAVGE